MTGNIKTLTVLAVMALTFAVLPTFGAAAATLEDGDYDVPIGVEVYSFTVEDGVATPLTDADVVWEFKENKDGEALNSLRVTVAGVTYDVEIEDDGVEVEPADEDDESTVSRVVDAALDRFDSEEEPSEEPVVEDEADNGADGDVVSTVARCAPRGKDARDLGLPTHGTFVSAAAAGVEDFSFEVGEGDLEGDWVANFGSLETAEEFCDLAGEILETLDEADEDEQRGNGNGQAKQEDKETGRPDDVGKPDDVGPKDKDRGND